MLLITGSILPTGSPNTAAETGNTLNNAGSTIIDLLLSAAFILAIIYLVWSGIQYISSAGSPEKVKTARQGLINAVIGIIIITCTYGVVFFATKVGSSINTVISTTPTP